MPTVGQFKSLGYWPSCVASGVTFTSLGADVFINATSINILSDSMEFWWLVDEAELNYDIQIEYIFGSPPETYNVNLSGTKIISAPTAPRNRVCYGNTITLEPDSAGEMLPVNHDDLALLYMLDSAGTNNPDIGATYQVVLLLTTFSTSFPNDLSPVIGEVVSGGFQSGFHYQVLFGDLAPSAVTASVSFTGITFYTIT